MLEVEGKVVQILDPITGEGRNGPWRKQEIIIETQGQYPKKICLTVWGDKIDVSSLSEGTDIKAGIDIASREHNGRWYTDVKAWRIDVSGADAGGAAVDPPAPDTYSDLPPEQGGDDLPF